MSARAVALLLAIGAATPAMAAQPKSCRPGLADYRALTTGDSLKAVEARLGCRGRRGSSMTIGKRSSVTYSWRGTGSFGANIILSFVNGRLTDKSQLGLE